MELLVEKGAVRGFRDTDMTPLLWKGTSTSVKDASGWIPLLLAAGNGLEAVMNMLEHYGGTIL